MVEASFNAIEDVLRDCGVTDATLAPRDREALDRAGYVLFPALINADWLKRLRAGFEAAFAGGRQPTGKQTGTRQADLISGTDEAFDGVFTEPKVLAAVYHVLRCPFRAAQLSARDPLPGYGRQGLHSDWFARAPSEPFRIATTIWLLDDFTAGNGATRLVPGTHRLLNVVPKNLADPASRHPDQITITGLAGSVLVFNGHLWHSGTRNDSEQSRRALQCLFVGRSERRFATAGHELPKRLSAAARYILGGSPV
jgi:ectoine hydroxylase-related dioxygenase (phytanoyl-CoA dioxygenase family)